MLLAIFKKSWIMNNPFIKKYDTLYNIHKYVHGIFSSFYTGFIISSSAAKKSRVDLETSIGVSPRVTPNKKHTSKYTHRHSYSIHI